MPEPQVIEIATQHLVWTFQVDESKRLRQTRFGSSASTNYDAFPAAGNGWLLDPALRAVHFDGDTSTDLRFASWNRTGLDQNRCETIIHLTDPNHPFHVSIHLIAYQDEDVVEQWVEMNHEEDGPVRLTQFASGNLTLAGTDFYLTQFYGDHCREATLEEERLTMGIKILDSKLGVRAHQFRSPNFLLARNGPMSEEAGEVIAGSLAWPGSFQFMFERHPMREGGGDDGLFITGGINPFASDFLIRPGEPFVTPRMIWAYSKNGAAQLTVNFHRWVRKYALKDGEKPGQILLNNWEATYFTFDEQKLKSLFRGAADMGFELFLLDDGWFGKKYPRDDDTQGLGDWMPNPAKLPNGVENLAQDAVAKGIRFGIWVEPEMVNPNSELYEAHPDWVIRQPNRELLFHRNQLILDLSNPQVEQYVFNVVNDLLSNAPNVSFVKWDCNRFIMQPGSPYLKAEDQTHVTTEYNLALLRIWDRLVHNHPKMEWMICSGGGGRVDFATLSHGQELWPSDMTDPVNRVKIQWGYSYLYPAKSLAAHVTRWGNRPLKFAIDVAMSGRFGVDMDLDRLSEEEKQTVRKGIEAAKQIRAVVQLGDQYRLESPVDGSRASIIFVSPDRKRAVVFVFPLESCPAENLTLKGLEEGRKYRINEVNPCSKPSLELQGSIVSTQELTEKGLNLPELKQYESLVLELTTI